MSTNLNVVAIVGNLTSDPEVRASNDDGPSVVSLRIANNVRAKVDGEWGEKANYFDVTVFAPQSRFCATYLTRGRQVSVSGRLDFREFTDKDGNKRNAVSIIANDVSPTGKKDDAPAQAEPSQDAPGSWDA